MREYVRRLLGEQWLVDMSAAWTRIRTGLRVRSHHDLLIANMRKSGLREARHNLAALIEEVRKGREVVITHRGRAVARLVPPAAPEGKGLPDLKKLRVTLRPVAPSLPELIVADGDDRF